jgi:hypothetical protein
MGEWVCVFWAKGAESSNLPCHLLKGIILWKFLSVRLIRVPWSAQALLPHLVSGVCRPGEACASACQAILLMSFSLFRFHAQSRKASIHPLIHSVRKVIFSIKVFVILLDYLKIPQVSILGDLHV